MEVLSVQNLRKSFSKKEVLRDVSFSVQEGEIVGFVGPNGAGKTTTIRLLTDLLRPDAGTVTICGHPLCREREKALGCVSAIVETPRFYPALTGKEHLDFLQKLRKIPSSKIEGVLEVVQMQNRINEKVGKYSLGMKQRLALAMCLAVFPKLLILDEPTNGLDPAGILAFRELLQQAAQQTHLSVFLSSHALNDMEKIATRVLFLQDGRILQNVPAAGSETVWTLTVADMEKAIGIFQSAQPTASLKKLDDNRLQVEMDAACFEKLIPLFFSANLPILKIERQERSLETAYKQIFKKDYQA